MGFFGYRDCVTTGYDAGVAAGSTWTTEGTPYTTAQMKLQNSTVVIYTNIYVGRDFVDETANGSNNICSIDTTGTINNGYPYLTNLVP